MRDIDLFWFLVQVLHSDEDVLCSDCNFRNAQRYIFRYYLFSRALSGLNVVWIIFLSLNAMRRSRSFYVHSIVTAMVGHIESEKNLRINQPILENLKYQFFTRWTSLLVAVGLVCRLGKVTVTCENSLEWSIPSVHVRFVFCMFVGMWTSYRTSFRVHTWLVEVPFS